jgi:hypothetical protein
MRNPNESPATLGTVSVTLSAGTTSTYTTDVATAGIINGKFITALAAQTNTATPTTDARTGSAFVAQGGGADTGRSVGTICVYVFGTTLAGAVAVTQGSIENLADTADNVLVRPDFPSLPDDFCPFSYVILTAGNGASAWTFGSSNWAATDVTDVYVNIGQLPDRPQAS